MDIHKKYRFCDKCYNDKQVPDDKGVMWIATTDDKGWACMEDHCVDCGFIVCECKH